MQLQGECTSEREPCDVWPVEPEAVDEPGETVGVASHPEVLGWIRGRSRSGCVPCHQREVVAERLELWPPRRRAVAHVAVDQDERGSASDPFVGDSKPADLD